MREGRGEGLKEVASGVRSAREWGEECAIQFVRRWVGSGVRVRGMVGSTVLQNFLVTQKQGHDSLSCNHGGHWLPALATIVRLI